MAIFGLAGSVWSVTFKMIVRYPRVLLPFLIKAIFEGLVLTVLFYSPRPPFSIIFARPIEAFFGAHFLHYPFNFNLLPTLFYYGQIFVMVTLGVIMYGMAIGMVYQAHSGSGEVRILGNFNRAVRRYFALLGTWTIIFILSLIMLSIPQMIIIKSAQPISSTIFLLKVIPYIGVILIFILETLFIYTYSAIIVERKGLFSAIRRSFNIVRRVFLTTLFLVLVPRIFEILFIILKQKQQGIMNITFPEITLFILGGIIVLSFITDSLVFLSTANLFILNQETEKGA